MHPVIVPAHDICTGWPVLGVPPSWYVAGGPAPGKPKELHRVLETRYGLTLDPGAEIRVVVDDRDTDHLSAPSRLPATDGLGPVELSQILTRSALRGFGQGRTQSTGEPYAGPEWAQRLPGYSFDERGPDRPRELRSVVIVHVVVTEHAEFAQQLPDAVSTIAEKLPVRASIYTAWLWALARLAH